MAGTINDDGERHLEILGWVWALHVSCDLSDLGSAAADTFMIQQVTSFFGFRKGIAVTTALGELER